MKICKTCDEDITNTHHNTKYCEPCKKKKIKEKEANRKSRSIGQRFCKCGEKVYHSKRVCDKCKALKKKGGDVFRAALKPQRDPNSSTAKLLERIGKPRSAIVRCF